MKIFSGRVTNVNEVCVTNMNGTAKPWSSYAVHTNRSHIQFTPIDQEVRVVNVCDLLIMAVKLLPTAVQLVVFIVKKIKNKRRPRSKD